MEDREIVAYYWARDPAALGATEEKYGGYCRTIAQQILGSREDAEECVNDVCLRAWNSIPPQRPRRLGAFLGRITRNLALDRYRRDRAEKRGGGELELIFDELASCIPGGAEPEGELARRELLGAINGFLAALPRDKRELFVRRYWYADPVNTLAAGRGVSAASVTMTLRRLRESLRRYLTERGFSV